MISVLRLSGPWYPLTMLGVGWLVVTHSLVALAHTAPATCVTEVSEHFSRQRFAAAAVTGERCWTGEHRPEALLYAIQARINLGHGAHAAFALRRFVAATKEGDQAAVPWAEQQIRGLVVDVELTIDEASITEGTVQARLLDHERDLLLVEVKELPSTGRGRALALDPGLWELRLFHGSRVIAEAQVEATEGATVRLAEAPSVEPIVEDPSPAPAPAPEPAIDRRARRTHLGLGIGIGGASLASAATGIALLARARERPDAPIADDPTTVVPWLNRANQTWKGAVLVGAGVGGALVTVTELLRAKRRVFIAEAAVGGALVGGGVLYAGLNMASYHKESSAGAAVDADFFDQRYRHEIASGTLLGVGSGIVTGAAIALITRAVADRRRR